MTEHFSSEEFTPLNFVGFAPAVVDDSAAGGLSARPAVVMRMVLGEEQVRCCLSLTEANTIIDTLMFAQNRARILIEEFKARNPDPDDES